MKKIKMMLLSFALLAVVGGALAFKAKFNSPICYTITTAVNDFCTTDFVRSTTSDVPGVISYTTDAIQFDQEGLKCYTWKDVDNHALGTTSLHCPDAATLVGD